MKKAIIVDIDGTLSNPEHRRHFVEGDKKDWDSFSAGCVNDTANHWCAELVNSFIDNDYEIIFVSGREEKFRSVTQDFLYKILACIPALHMRNDGDYRSDTIIKEEIYKEHIKGKYDILFCVDDRPSVCRMWRSLGLTVLQCADIEF